MNESVIEMNDVTKRYGAKVAIEKMSPQVHRGEVFGVLGPNGAGKTTTVECAVDLRTPDSGTVRVLGLDPAADPELVRQRVGVQLQQAVLPNRMKVSEAMAIFAAAYARPPGVHVLVLTTYDADHDIVRAMEAGASGVQLKAAPREELFRAVRAAARGEMVLAPAVTARLFGRLRGGSSGRAGVPEQAPTERELEVLALVAQGLTNRAIGRQLAVSEAAVKTHLVHVFTKLGVADRTAAVTAALDRGLISLPRRAPG